MPREVVVIPIEDSELDEIETVKETDMSPETLFKLILQGVTLPKFKSYDERNRLIAYLRLQGWSLPDIARRLRSTVPAVKKVCDDYLAACSKDTLFALLDLDLARLDFLYRKSIERVDKEGTVAINSAIKVLERKSKLLGLDATIKSILTDPEKSIQAEHLLMMGIPTSQKESYADGLERYRNAQASIAEDKLAVLRKQLIPKETVEHSMQVLGNQIAKAQELLSKQYGPNASQILQDVIESINSVELPDVNGEQDDSGIS